MLGGLAEISLSLKGCGMAKLGEPSCPVRSASDLSAERLNGLIASLHASSVRPTAIVKWRGSNRGSGGIGPKMSAMAEQKAREAHNSPRLSYGYSKSLPEPYLP